MVLLFEFSCLLMCLLLYFWVVGLIVSLGLVLMFIYRLGGWFLVRLGFVQVFIMISTSLFAC